MGWAPEEKRCLERTEKKNKWTKSKVLSPPGSKRKGDGKKKGRRKEREKETDKSSAIKEQTEKGGRSQL